jgi:hypothetical protein
MRRRLHALALKIAGLCQLLGELIADAVEDDLRRMGGGDHG